MLVYIVCIIDTSLLIVLLTYCLVLFIPLTASIAFAAAYAFGIWV